MVAGIVSSLDVALTRWRRALGDEHVDADSNELDRAATATYPTTPRVLAILRPGCRDEVRECVIIAQETGVPLYPISRGKNWGYGSRVPVRDGCAILDLSRLNRILDYDERLAYVTVEPGVTFRSLYQFLREQRSDLLMSATGSSPDASIVGNVLERGIGTGPYAERLGGSCDFEVVLPTGNVMRTGFGRYDGAAAPIYRWGVGPHVDGMFTQSNFGVVTRMTTWLTPCPDHLAMLTHRIDDAAKLGPLADRLQSLVIRGAIRPPVVLFNDIRVFSFLTQYPWAETGGRAPLPDDLRQSLRQSPRFGGAVGAWTGEIAFTGVDRAQVAAQRAAVEARVCPLVDNCALIEADRDELRDLLAHPNATPATSDLEHVLRQALLKRYLGIPLDVALLQAYWRKRTPPPPPRDLDPDRDGCGLIWLGPVVPFTSEHVLRGVGILTEVMQKHGFDPALSLQGTTERSVTIVGSIHYDRDVAGEDEQAIACYREANHELARAGYYAYRQPTLSQGNGNGHDAYGNFLATIKQAVDPNGVLAPGRGA
jgi:4-cresol dehydrogenase (hydroxylating)